MRIVHILALLFALAASSLTRAATPSFSIGLLKYRGGGDWYANLETSLPNLIRFCNQNLQTNIAPEQVVVDVGSMDLFSVPFVHMTGHGNVVFSDQEVQNLRTYLIGGGFLHIDDNYGLDKFVRVQMKRVFPELDFIELPYSHPIYHQAYNFPNGLPKIHEHDNKPPQGFGIIFQGRLVCFYSVECDLGDGWESTEVHQDSKDAHLRALQMGANLIQYSLLGEGFKP